MFKPIGQTRSAVDLCADAIRDTILDGRFKVGDRLPPERALADMFDLNRLTIRGALTRLTAEGLLSVRQGGGYRVEDVYRTTGPRSKQSIAPCSRELCPNFDDRRCTDPQASPGPRRPLKNRCPTGFQSFGAHR